MTRNFTKILVLCFISLVISKVAGAVKIYSLKIDMNPNDYFGEIEKEIKVLGDDSSISATVPIKKDLDEKFEVKVKLNFNKIPILRDRSMLLCDAISPDGFFKPLVEKIEPSGKFPEKCPIPQGTWNVTDLVIDLKDFLPFGLVPTGEFDAEFDIGLPNEDPLIKILVDGHTSPPIKILNLRSLFPLF